MLTLDGTLPAMGTGSGIGSGAGLGAIGGGVAGLVLGSLLGNNGGGLFGGGGSGNANAAEFGAINNQIQTLQAQVGSNDLRNEMESMENTFATISSGQTSANAANFNNLSQQIGNVQTAQASNNFTTLQSINDLGRDVTAQSNQAQLQQLNSFNQLNTTTLQGFNQAAFNQNIATQQIIAQGVAQAAANAQCCCELKEAINASEQRIEALINSNTMQDLRDKNVALAGEVSNFRQNQFLIANLKPTAGVII